jgi:Pectate lyase superfamily protein
MPDRLNDVINVKDWGALGNGVHNDAPNIQAAINYCLSSGTSPSGTVKSPGGVVYFPPGMYKCNSALQVSSNYDVCVVLRGASREGTQILTYISKGAGAIDNISRVEHLACYSVKLTRPGASAISILGSVDASECINAAIISCHFYGPDSTRANDPSLGVGNSHAPWHIAFCLGHGGIAIACRAQNAGLGYAVSGEAAAIVGCSSEVSDCSVRLGWGMRTVASTSNNGAGRIRLTLSSNAGLVDGASYYIEGVAGVAGDSLQVISMSGISDGLSVDLPNCNYTSSSSGGRIIGEIACYGASVTSLQTERVLSRIELYNAHGCYVASNYHVNQDGPCQHQTITNATYSGGVVTVTTSGNHNIPAGDWVICLWNMPSSWLPTYSQNSLVNAHSNGPNSNTFTYPTNQTPSGGFGSPSWVWPPKYGYRIRKVTECYLGSDNWNCSPVFAFYDFDYAGQAQNNRNNVGFGITNPGSVFHWVPPTHASRPWGGWTFRNCSGQALSAFSPTSTDGPRLVYADLPGRPGVYQPGPYEGQEYDIVDGNPAGGAWGASVSGGGSGKYKVRYGGSPLDWRRIG